MHLPLDAEIIRVADGADGASSDRIALGDLVGGQRADVYGESDVSGCIVADTIVAFAD